MGQVFQAWVLVVAVIAGAIAAISGFGIGSLLSPLFATRMDLKLAVAAVSIPHLLATGLRCWMLRKHIDRNVLVSFGSASAAGGLAGALFHNFAANQWLVAVFAGLLIFVGLSSLSGLSAKLRFPKSLSLAAGGLSGTLGGMVGNQGGIRSAAMLGFDLDKQAFVATATAIGVVVDLVRMPVYLATEVGELQRLWLCISIASAGTLLGTVFGRKLLSWISESLFRRIVGALICALGIYMMWRAVSGAAG